MVGRGPLGGKEVMGRGLTNRTAVLLRRAPESSRPSGIHYGRTQRTPPREDPAEVVPQAGT